MLPCLQQGLPPSAERTIVSGFDCTFSQADAHDPSECVLCAGDLLLGFFEYYGMRFGCPESVSGPNDAISPASNAEAVGGKTGDDCSNIQALTQTLEDMLQENPQLGAKKAYLAIKDLVARANSHDGEDPTLSKWKDSTITEKLVRRALAEIKSRKQEDASAHVSAALPPIICPRLGRPLTRAEKGWLHRKWLHIEDPFETTHNVSDVLMQINERRVFNEFKRAAEMLSCGKKLRAIM
eukprot:SAG31_NODE_3036_length_4763_cov_3.456046_3_plen_238_part_00